ncbi:MAG: hypothetical protein HRU11_05090 [Parvularculaceae bacterium]|nr:hypothetical protein [Parvularculaceae bacterium]
MLMIGLATLATTAMLDSDLEYRVEILYQEKNGLRTRTVKVRDEFDLSEGSFALEDDDLSDAPLLIGDVDVNGNKVTVDMTVCRLGQSPCDEIGSPRISFIKGRRASIALQSRDGVYYRIRFRP